MTGIIKVDDIKDAGGNSIISSNGSGTFTYTFNAGSIAQAALAADIIDGTKLADDAINSEHYTDGSIDTAHIGADQITNAKIADESIDSEHYANASIDTAHIANAQITTALIADDAVTEAKMAANSVDSQAYVDGSIDTVYIGATQVTGAKLAADVISAQTALGAEPADTDEFMVSDAGVLKRVDYSYIKGGGITVADQWNLTDGFTGDATPIAANLTQANHGGFGNLGSSMTQSSGIFTFPSTGIYFVQAEVGWYYHNAHSRYNVIFIQGTTDNSTYVEMAQASQGIYDSDHYTQVSAVTSTLVDVTNVSNVKVRFSVDVFDASVRTLSDVDVGGTPGKNVTTFTFIRLGDT